MNKVLQVIQENYVTIIILAIAVTGVLFFVSCKGKKAIKEPVISKVNNPEWSKDANIYEVNIRQFTPEGTFKAFEDHLPRLKDMGIDILWLMPVHPIGEKNRKGSLGSYYSVKDYLDVNPDFGTMEDFKSVVNKAHELGMYVILDWVANHTAWDNKLIEDHPEWYSVDSAGNMVSPYDWTDVADLSFDNEALRDYMKNALVFWVKEANIDGYRCDVAEMVPTDFWNSVRPELEKIKPVFMLAEAEKPEHQIEAFDMSYGWEMHHIMNKIAKGEYNANDLENVLIKSDTLFPGNSYRMYFTSNHDENSWNGTEYERMGDGVKAFAALIFVVPGMPMIYSGQEAGLDKRLLFFEKDTISWDNLEMQEYYRALINIKKRNPALWNGKYGGSWERISTINDEAVFAIFREKEDNKVLGIFNLSDTMQTINLKGKNYTGDYVDMLSGEPASVSKNLEFNLQPWEFFIFANNK